MGNWPDQTIFCLLEWYAFFNQQAGRQKNPNRNPRASKLEIIAKKISGAAALKNISKTQPDRAWLQKCDRLSIVRSVPYFLHSCVSCRIQHVKDIGRNSELPCEHRKLLFYSQVQTIL